MYCIDTNIIINFLRGDIETIKRFRDINNNEIFITPLTLCELFRGAFLSNNPEIKISLIKDLTDSFTILGFNEKVCLEYGKIYAQLSKKGKIIENIDIMIGCFAKVNDLILVTRNKKHFENLGINIEEW